MAQKYGDKMNYSLNIGEWNSIFAVPASIVDRYIKLAGANDLKLLLFLLRHGGREFSADKLKAELGFTEDGELEDAAFFWIRRGIIRYNDKESELSAVREEIEASGASDIPADVKQAEYVQQTIDEISPKRPAVNPIKTSPARVSSGEIASRIKESPEIKMLFDKAEELNGKRLSQRFEQTLIALVDHYGLPAGVALMLVKYCLGIGKKSTNYIETKAAEWNAAGIDSIEKADKRIRELEKIPDFELRLRKGFEISGEFDQSKKTLLKKWMIDWNFSEEMIVLALDKTVDLKKIDEKTGGPALSYANGILENWRNQNIRTPEEADAAGASVKKPKAQSGEGAFDVDSIMTSILNSYK